MTKLTTQHGITMFVGMCFLNDVVLWGRRLTVWYILIISVHQKVAIPVYLDIIYYVWKHSLTIMYTVEN